MIKIVFTIASIVLILLAFVSLYRAYVGPACADRVIAINVISTKVTVLIVLIAMVTDQHIFVDVALVYAMMGFMATVCISKYLEKGKLI